MIPAHRQALEALRDKWRLRAAAHALNESKSDVYGDSAMASRWRNREREVTDCANELDALLAASPAETPLHDAVRQFLHELPVHETPDSFVAPIEALAQAGGFDDELDAFDSGLPMDPAKRPTEEQMLNSLNERLKAVAPPAVPVETAPAAPLPCLCGSHPRLVDCMKAASDDMLAPGYICRRDLAAPAAARDTAPPSDREILRRAIIERAEQQAGFTPAPPPAETPSPALETLVQKMQDRHKEYAQCMSGGETLTLGALANAWDESLKAVLAYPVGDRPTPTEMPAIKVGDVADVGFVVGRVQENYGDGEINVTTENGRDTDALETQVQAIYRTPLWRRRA